jgi:hypothetical protein
MPRLLALLAVILVLSGCRRDEGVVRDDEGVVQAGRAEARAVDERAVSLETRRLVIEAGSGSVTVIGTDEAQARLTFERVARAGTEGAAAERLERLTISESGDRDAFIYRVDTDRLEGARVNVEARVPRHASVEVRLTRGSIRISEFAGDVRVDARNGEILAAGLAGQRVRLTTEQGNIEAGFATIPLNADNRIETTNGTVRLTLPPDGSADIVVAAGTGSVRAEGLNLTRERYEERRAGVRFRAQLGAGDASLRAETRVGDVMITGGQSLRLDDLPTIQPGAAEPAPDTLAAPAAERPAPEGTPAAPAL